MKRLFNLGLLAAAGLAMSGCATITTGSNQSITVLTDPSGAECQLDRQGSAVAIINPTPGAVQVDKSKDTIAIRCRKEGFQDTAGTLGSEFQGMTFGNIIFGGIIGIAVDAGSGAMNEYPSQISIVLIPEAFRSLADRDAFFDAAVSRSRARTTKAIADAQTQCSSDDGCESNVKRLQSIGDAEIASLETQRVTARISS
ncbi:MAG: hypothetical protein HQ481_04455 [Alphaproteobacteria bacterium]|nr:hypothetical protein [Alphaproteobacteria bacterium]